jgi:hypothetical protein
MYVGPVRFANRGLGDRPPIQALALGLSVLFIGIATIGFIPWITRDAPGSFIGQDSDAELFGIFQVSVVHNLFHLSYGLIGLAMARTVRGAKGFVFGGGVGLMALWLAGIVGLLDWLPSNTAHHWLHLVDGIGMVAGGFLLTRRGAQSPPVAVNA